MDPQTKITAASRAANLADLPGAILAWGRRQKGYMKKVREQIADETEQNVRLRMMPVQHEMHMRYQHQFRNVPVT